MRLAKLAALAVISALVCCAGGPAFSTAPAVEWRGWQPDLFKTAKTENRFVLLDLEAVWCHWCHVMRDTTYVDPIVTSLLAKKYLAVRVDQDSSPSLAARYGNWGWPATIIFTPDGEEIVKLRGYLPPERMQSILQAVIDDPSPGPSVVDHGSLVPSKTDQISVDQRERLKRTFINSFDADLGAWGSGHKYIDANSMDYAVLLAAQGDTNMQVMARKTLDAARALIDPHWGGVYQYSDSGSWLSPHFEKIMFYQASYLRQYSATYALWGDAKYKAAAEAIAGYLTRVLRDPDGGFYTSQDADIDSRITGKVFYRLSAIERQKLGRAPSVDKNIYSRENGWAIQALVAYSDVTGEQAPLDIAINAAEWVLTNRTASTGGFWHGAEKSGPQFLSDNVEMARALFALYASTGDRRWLKTASETANFVAKAFASAAGGYRTDTDNAASGGVFQTPYRDLEEQVSVTRMLSLAHHYTGQASLQDAARHGLKYLMSADLIDAKRPLPGVLLAEIEFAQAPLHLTVVGKKSDPAARVLHASARRYKYPYKRIDWWDRSEGPMSNPDVTYPELDRSAAFICTDSLCSLPAYSVDEFSAALVQTLRREALQQ